MRLALLGDDLHQMGIGIASGLLYAFLRVGHLLNELFVIQFEELKVVL